MSANENGQGGTEVVRILVADGPEPGWWVVRPALAVRRADAAPDDPYLLAFDDADLEVLVGRDAPLELRRKTLQTSVPNRAPVERKTADRPDTRLTVAKPRAS